ncbi:MAG: hypothetical protein RLZZ316_1866 [Bacteroidota bacterium]
MRLFITLFLLTVVISVSAQDLTGIWRGSFVSSDNKMMDLFNMEERYKYEVQIDNRGKIFQGVTYSYKTTVFYGKASSKGTINPKTGKVILEEGKLLEIKMPTGNYACWMVCFLQYTKNGKEEYMEGRYSSYKETDSTDCGKGTVFLRKVSTSDFYKEAFLVKREKEIAIEKEKQKAIAANKKAPVVTTPKTNTVATTTVKPKPAPTTTAANKPNTVNTKPAPVQDKDIKAAPVTSNPAIDKKTPQVKIKEPVMVPMVLKNRENELVQTFTVNSNEITISLYDNGTIDHDTVSVYLDKKLVLSKKMLTAAPLTVKVSMDDTNAYHELVMVAENLGEIPPNTSLMVIKAGEKSYEVRITSTEQKNAMVIFKYEKPK